MRIWLVFLFACLLLGTFSCEKYFEDVNRNPNQPELVTPDVILPAIQARLAYGAHSQVSQYTSILTQQVRGIARCGALTVYRFTEEESEYWWTYTMYAGALNDLHKLIDLAKEKGYTQYEATAKVLMAYGMLLVTDLFGDAPYSEAFLGFENLEPKYDRQEDIYASIQQLLDEAMIGLNAESAPVSPGADDLIFGGDMVQWRKFANALRARTFLHLGKVSASNYSAALAAIDAGAFTTAADDAVFHWGINETEAGPWYQFIQQRDHIIYVGYMFDLLEANHDPRYFAYLDTLNFNSLGSYYAKPDAVFFFHSFMEQKFIEAEAAFQTGDFSRAASACNDAVLASLSRHNISNPGFEATYASASASDITLKKIMVQKYIAMFLDVEAFTDWRRTGIPSLTPAIGNSTGNIIPRRLLYPTSERRYNSNNFQKIPITEPVWWDQ